MDRNSPSALRAASLASPADLLASPRRYRTSLTPMKTFLSRWLPVLVWMAIIFFISSYSNPYQAFIPAPMQSPVGITLPDAPAGQMTLPNETAGHYSHTGLYFILSVLIYRALNRRGGILLALALTVLYALSDETHQLFVPGRAFELSDLALDSLGALLGIFIYAVFSAWYTGRRSKNLPVE